MKYNKGQHVYFKSPTKYEQGSIDYREITGVVVEVYPRPLKAYEILPDGYDTPQFVPEHNVLGII